MDGPFNPPTLASPYQINQGSQPGQGGLAYAWQTLQIALCQILPDAWSEIKSVADNMRKL